jgi:hypothetical protein
MHRTIIAAPEDEVRLKLDAILLMLMLEANMTPAPAPLEYGVDYGAWGT